MAIAAHVSLDLYFPMVSYIGQHQYVFAPSLPLMKSEMSSFSSDSQLPVLPQGQASIVIVVFLVSHL